jgi:hypothetical protein
VIEKQLKSHGGVMKKYIIEREIPKIGSLGQEQLRQGAAKSNQVLCDLGPNIQWQESFVTADKMFCVYLTTDEELIHEHAKRSGFPATKVTEVGKTIDPTTAAAATTEDRQARTSESKAGTRDAVKQKLQIATLVCAFLFTLVAPAAAQSRAKADIPFNFTVGDKSLNAGEYTIEELSPLTLALRDGAGKRQVIINGIRVESVENNGRARLLFLKVGDRYLLTQFWPNATDSGISVPKTRLERELTIGSDLPAQNAVVAMY